MILPDVNVLVYAQRREMPQHERYRAWLEQALNGGEPVALVGPVVSGFLRVVTNRRIFTAPTPLATAVAHVEAMPAAALGAELVSADRDFARFPGLRWRRPLGQ